MRRILSVLSLAGLVACITPDHTTTQPRGFPGLRGVMNHLPDGRWQFVVELPNADRLRSYRLESPGEPLDIEVEVDVPRSRATWFAGADRVQGGRPFQLRLWADGDDFPLQVLFPAGGKDYRREGSSALVILALLPRR
jgi:hypothetical protein